MSAGSADDWPGELIADPSLQRTDGGRVLIGGSPLTVLRFAEPVDLTALRSTEVIDRLIDGGMVHPDPPSGRFTPAQVTVVIPVFGHPDALDATLGALADLDDDLAEIIVVDDASDEPASICTSVEASDAPRVRLVRRSSNGGPGAARNTGLAEVATPLVSFLDAGCVPEPAWLEPLLAQFTDPRVALAAPRVRADPQRFVGVGHTSVVAHRALTHGTTASDKGTAAAGGTSGDDLGVTARFVGRSRRELRRAIARYETCRSSLDLGTTPARIAPGSRVSYVPAACLVVRVEALSEVGAFDERLQVGEDVDLIWRLAAWGRARYVPAAGATHDVRGEPSAWLARRGTYGASAAPLAIRHPGALAPVSLSPWSATAWGCAAAGHPLIGLGIAAASTCLLARKLDRLEHPFAVACRIAGVGNLAAGRLIADAMRRPWWPFALAGVWLGPRALRRSIAVAWLVVPLVEWRPDTGLDPVSWLVLRLVDDAAYGTGVWIGCLRERTFAPLVPDLRAGRVTPSR